MSQHPLNGKAGSGDAGEARVTDFLQWRDSWSLGVDFMDEDHRALAQRLNQLARDYGNPLLTAPLGSTQDRSRCPLPEVLAELIVHTRAHFQREEATMEAVDFPGLAAHKSEHDLLLAELSVLVRERRETGIDGLEPDVLEGLKDWLLGHVLELDRELAEFIKEPPIQPRNGI